MIQLLDESWKDFLEPLSPEHQRRALSPQYEWFYQDKLSLKELPEDFVKNCFEWPILNDFPKKFPQLLKELETFEKSFFSKNNLNNNEAAPLKTVIRSFKTLSQRVEAFIDFKEEVLANKNFDFSESNSQMLKLLESIEKQGEACQQFLSMYNEDPTISHIPKNSENLINKLYKEITEHNKLTSLTIDYFTAERQERSIGKLSESGRFDRDFF